MPRTITRARPTAADLLAEPTTISIGRACEYLGVSRSVGYEMAKKNTFPVHILRLGSTYRIPTARLIDYLGVRTPTAVEDDDPSRAL